MSKTKDKDQDILAAAAAIFSSKGFHHASIGDIADAAGIGKGTVYEYFPSKDALLKEVVHLSCTRYLGRLRKKMAFNNTFIDKLNGFIDYHNEVVHENIKMAEMMLQYNGPGLKAEMKTVVKSMIQQMRTEVTGVIQEIFVLGQQEGLIADVDLEFVSDIFFDMVIRSSVRIAGFCSPSVEPVSEKEKLVAMLFGGVGMIK